MLLMIPSMSSFEGCSDFGACMINLIRPVRKNELRARRMVTQHTLLHCALDQWLDIMAIDPCCQLVTVEGECKTIIT